MSMASDAAHPRLTTVWGLSAAQHMLQVNTQTMLQAHDWHLSGKYFYTALAFICHVAAFAMRRCIWPTSHKHLRLSFAGQTSVTSAFVVKFLML
jgi:hypothetical protein